MKTKLLFYLILLFGLNSYSQIINVANGLNLPYSIFIDGNDLYVPELNSNKITKFDASLINQTLGTTFATGTNIPSGFARYGNYLYFAKSVGPNPNDKIVRIDLTIPNSLPTDFLTVYPDSNGINQGLDMGNIIVIGNYMYITDYTLHGILKVDLTQNNPVPSIVVTGINTPYGLASKGNDLYISEWENGNISNNYSAIYKIDVSQTNPILSTVISGLGGIPSMAIKGDFLFINEASEVNISYINLTQLNPIKTVLLNFIANLSLAIKDNYLYFDQYAYNEVSKIDVSSIVNPCTTLIIPTFNPIAPICSGATVSALPTTSLPTAASIGITGTWSPSLNNLATTTYTFTPDAGQCATTVTMIISVFPSTINTTISNISTGVDFSGNAIALNAIDPYWQLSSSPHPIGTPVYNTTPSNIWYADPTTLLSASWVNATGSYLLNAPGTYVYERDIVIDSNVYNFDLDFSIACDDWLVSVELIKPDFTSINLPFVSIQNPITLSQPIISSIANPMIGTWKIRVTMNTYISTPQNIAGGFLLTGHTILNSRTLTLPTFAVITPICSGSPIAPLPITSTNGIMGTWSPALNNLATTIYTFTPNAGQCATTATMTIVVNPVNIITTTATACGSYTWAKNGVTYTASGTYAILVGACGSEVLNLTIIPAVIPTFTQIAPICSGATLVALPTTSTNTIGITGTWSPALNNLATRRYTFTPNAGQCATTATMIIVVNPNVTPTFTPITPICSGAVISPLPTTSLATSANPGITGTWSPALNNLATTTYTFTPNAGQCATTATMTISITSGSVWYADADGDTYGNPAVTITSCTQPIGYVADSTDCDDTRACVHTAITTTFAPIAPICSGEFLAPLPTTSTNGIVGAWSPTVNNTTTTTYTFTPNSGQCATTETMTVTVNPLITNITTVVHDSCLYGTNYTWSVNGSTYSSSGTYTYINPLTNCLLEQLDLTILLQKTWYADADGDGYGNPAISLLSCTQPSGHSKNNTDCNDLNAAINPCAVEIRNDLIDNNCNGLVDEKMTTILPSQCGSRLINSNDFIYAVIFPGAANYRFQATNLSTNVVSTSTPNSLNKFMLTSLSNFDFDTSYTIQVSVFVGGFWQPYSPACCIITTPSPRTQVMASQCNTTVATMGTYIYCDVVPFQNGYKFKVTNLNTNVSLPFIPGGALNKFKMDNFPCAFSTFDTSYKVEVAVKKRDGTYLPYGPACTITTPSFPTTQIQPSQCGFTASSGSQIISASTIATSLGTVTHYRFKITNFALCFSQTFDSSTNNFILNNFYPNLIPNTTYNVEVSLEICGVYGPYGTVCTIKTPLVLPRAFQKENPIVDEFTVIAFPNPFTESFNLDIKTASESTIQIRVYDMIGKLIENRECKVSDIENVNLGLNYASGVYNIIVSQDDKVETIRMIRR
jgi:hypothetical protein